MSSPSQGCYLTLGYVTEGKIYLGVCVWGDSGDSEMERVG